MKRLILAALLSFLGTVALHARDAKQSLRVELAYQQHSFGYSLVDGWAGQVYVVSVEDRTAKRVKARDIQKFDSVQCSSPEGRYSVFHKNGLWLRDNESGEALQVEAEGQFSTQCFSPEGRFVYSAGKIVRVYDLAKKKSMDVGKGYYAGFYPTWSPDGEWLGFDDGKHYVLLNPKTGTRRKLFSTKDATGAEWSPDSRYLTYTKPGGSMGGFLFWGIKCIEPYRVWVWRVEDDAHDWVQEICKPGRGFTWVKNSDLLFDKPTGEESLSAGTAPTGWHKVDAGPFSILAPPGWEFHQLPGVDSFVGEFVGDNIVFKFDYGEDSNPLKKEKKPAYVVIHKTIGGRRARIVSPRTPGHGITGVYIPNVENSQALTLFGQDLTSTQQELALRIFETLRFGGPPPKYALPPPPPRPTQNLFYMPGKSGNRTMKLVENSLVR
jgi:hypothetical protein